MGLKRSNLTTADNMEKLADDASVTFSTLPFFLFSFLFFLFAGQKQLRTPRRAGFQQRTCHAASATPPPPGETLGRRGAWRPPPLLGWSVQKEAVERRRKSEESQRAGREQQAPEAPQTRPAAFSGFNNTLVFQPCYFPAWLNLAFDSPSKNKHWRQSHLNSAFTVTPELKACLRGCSQAPEPLLVPVVLNSWNDKYLRLILNDLDFFFLIITDSSDEAAGVACLRCPRKGGGGGGDSSTLDLDTETQGFVEIQLASFVVSFEKKKRKKEEWNT